MKHFKFNLIKSSNLLRSSYCLLDRPSDLISKSIEVCYASEIGSLIFHAFIFFLSNIIFFRWTWTSFWKKMKITHLIKSIGIGKEYFTSFSLIKKINLYFSLPAKNFLGNHSWRKGFICGRNKDVLRNSEPPSRFNESLFQCQCSVFGFARTVKPVKK